MNNCRLCGGSGYINLALRHRLSVLKIEHAAIPSEIQEHSRRYACPECKEDDVPHGFILVDHVQKADPRAVLQFGEGYIHEMKRVATRALAEELLRIGAIAFEERSDAFSLEFRAVVGVVSKESAARLDAEVSQRAAMLLDGIAGQAAKSISQWGSHYTGDEGAISKSMAMRFVREAFRDGLKEARERAFAIVKANT